MSARNLQNRRSTQAWAIKTAREWALPAKTDTASRGRLAKALTEATGQEWTVTMVRNMELGTKRVPGELIPILADVLGVTESWLHHGLSVIDAESPPIRYKRATTRAPMGISRFQPVTAPTHLLAAA